MMEMDQWNQWGRSSLGLIFINFLWINGINGPDTVPMALCEFWNQGLEGIGYSRLRCPLKSLSYELAYQQLPTHES